MSFPWFKGFLFRPILKLFLINSLIFIAEFKGQTSLDIEEVNVININQADQFKEFIQNPPTISCISWSWLDKDDSNFNMNGEKILSQRISWYSKARIKTNAFVFTYGRSNKHFLDPNIDPLHDNYIFGKIDSHYWLLSGPTLSIADSNEFKANPNCPLKHAYMDSSMIMEMIMSMGIVQFERGEKYFRWIGDSFHFTNSWGCKIKGNLSRDNKNRAEKLTYSIKNDKNTNTSHFISLYEYDEQNPLVLQYLPNRIKELNVSTNNNTVKINSTREFVIYFINVETNELSDDMFYESQYMKSIDPKVFIQTNIFTNGQKYYNTTRSPTFRVDSGQSVSVLPTVRDKWYNKYLRIATNKSNIVLFGFLFLLILMPVLFICFKN